VDEREFLKDRLSFVSNRWLYDSKGLNGTRELIFHEIINTEWGKELIQLYTVREFNYVGLDGWCRTLGELLGPEYKPKETKTNDFSSGKHYYYLSRVPADTALPMQYSKLMIINEASSSMELSEHFIGKITFATEDSSGLITEYDNPTDKYILGEGLTCEEYVKYISFYWSRDTSGYNGFRRHAGYSFVNKCDSFFRGKTIDEFLSISGFGMPDEISNDPFRFNENSYLKKEYPIKGRYYRYYFNRPLGTKHEDVLKEKYFYNDRVEISVDTLTNNIYNISYRWYK
jgi:hypothetical protein